MKLKESTFAIIAEKKDSISHKWFDELHNGNWWVLGDFYIHYKGGGWDTTKKMDRYKDIPIYTESEFEAILKAEQGFIPCGQGDNICNCKSADECGYVIDGIKLEFKDDYSKAAFGTYTFGGKSSIGKNAQTFPAKGDGNITLEGFEPKQITISYNLALEYIAERLGVDKGILKIENCT